MMSVTTDDYNNLRGLLLNNMVNEKQIDKLKRQYESEINCPRRLDSVKCVQDLVELLEKRAVLSEKDITILQEIAALTNNRRVLTELHRRHDPIPEVISYNTFNNGNQDNDLSDVLKSPDSKGYIKDKVNDLISQEIGRSWMEFARALRVKESQIDKLKMKYSNDCEQCVIEVLNFHAKNENGPRWGSLLLSALEKARRNDLKKSVQNIIDHSYQ